MGLRELYRHDLAFRHAMRAMAARQPEDQLAKRADLAWQISELASAGKIVVHISYRDCDRCDGVSKRLVPATVIHVEQAVREFERWSDGTFSWRVI